MEIQPLRVEDHYVLYHYARVIILILISYEVYGESVNGSGCCAVLLYFATLLVTRIGLRRETDVLHDAAPNLKQN